MRSTAPSRRPDTPGTDCSSWCWRGPLQHAGAAVLRPDVSGLGLSCTRGFLVPSLQRLLGAGIVLTEGPKGGHGNRSLRSESQNGT